MEQKINFQDKQFSLIENSKTGEVNAETVFKYQQEGDLVTADYYGGTIKYGKIIAILEDHQLDMFYQCVTIDNEFKAGKAIANISFTENGKMLLDLQWEWLNDKKEKGVSQYLEN